MKRIVLASLLVMFALFANAANVTLTVNNTRYQHVKGFGAFVCSPQFTYNHMSESEIRQVWGPNSTLKCNIMRLYLPIGENSFSQSLSTARLAKNLGLFVFASPWSMPAEWKTINSINAKVNNNQNYLKEQYYGTYADYLNKYVTYLRNNGVNLDAISIQNEPDWPCEYAGCIFTTNQIVNFLANYAGRINCKVIAPETIGMSDNYANALLNSNAALNNFEIYGGHQYAGIGSAFKNLANRGKELWMTEYLINWTEGDNAQNRNVSWASDAFNFADAINNCMLNNVNAWVHYTAKRFYSIMGDGQRGTTSGQLTKRGYILGNYSRFITGSTRLGSSFSSGDLRGSAYLSQTGDTIFAVIINSSGNSHNLTVSLPFYTKGGKMAVTSSSKNLQESNLSFNATNRPSVSIDASSVTTLVFVSSSSAKVAEFDYDLASGRYYANPEDLAVSGDLSYNPSSGVLSLPAGKSGKLTLTFNSANFSNVSKIKMSREGDDIFNTLMIRNTAGNSVNTDGGAFYSSRYELNYNNYQGNSASVATLEWEGRNEGSATKTMTLRQILIQVDVMRADKKHEVALDRYAFGVWDGIGANANKTGNDDDMEYNIDQCIAGYGTIYGNGNVKALNYADLTRYGKLRVYGDNGVHIRALFNRPNDTSSDYVLKEGDITNGVFEVDLRSVGSYAHLNALKVGAGTGAAWRVMVVDDNDVMDYHISGKQYVAGNLAEALSDRNATNYDATGLRNPSAVALNTANKNALIYVDNDSRLSNAANVVVKNGSSYSAKNIELTDAAYVAAITADAYLAGGTTENCTWKESNGNWTFEWGANTNNAWVEIMHWVILTESQKGTQFRYLLIDTEEFTEKWGVSFLDGDGNTLATQGYWNPMSQGASTTKIIDIDALFAAAGRSGDRSKLTKIRLFNVETTNPGKVVVKRAYLYNDAGDFVYPFFAPYDIAAQNATLNTAVPQGGFTTLTMPFVASLPGGYTSHALLVDNVQQFDWVDANRPMVLQGQEGAVSLTASNTTVKATDGLEAGVLKGTYRTTSVAAGNYVQGASGGDSFSPVDGLQFAAVASGAEPSLLPFRAYATAKVVTTEPENPEPDDPVNPDPDDPNPTAEPFTLTVSSAGVATLYLGFDAVIPTDVDFFVAAAVKSIDGVVALLQKTKGGIIPANTGMLIFANPGTYTLYPSPVPATEQLSSMLHGVLTDTPVSTIEEQEDADIFILSRGTSEYVGFKPVSESLKKMSANKAYLPMPAGSEVKFINISFGGQVVTGIEDIKAALTNPATNDIFDLSGRRVSNPTKGIYIIDGKKVLVK